VLVKLVYAFVYVPKFVGASVGRLAARGWLRCYGQLARV